MTHKDAGQAGSGEQVRRYALDLNRDGVRGLRKLTGDEFIHLPDQYVHAADHDRVVASLSAEKEALQARVTWLEELSGTRAAVISQKDAENATLREQRDAMRDMLDLARTNLVAWIGAFHEDIDCNDDQDLLEKIDALLSLYRKGP